MKRQPPRSGLIMACADMLERLGASQMRVGYSDEDDGLPVAWYCAAHFRVSTAGPGWEAAGGMTPETAMLRLLEQVVDGSKCEHCGRPAGIVEDRQASQMFDGGEFVCWYAYDPEVKKFRRECEGRAP